jgi:4,5-DOPA dioxygenase extradiol
VTTERLPTVFIGHGNPMYAIEPNRFAEAWTALGREIPRPRAVLAISAHWYVAELAVTSMERPRTIHDFGGFPQLLFDVQYPAPGSPELADRVKALVDGSSIAPDPVVSDTGWGLDHGTWSVMRHLYPDADVPVVQLSVDGRRSGRFHLAVGAALTPLRDERVLILASGNVVHNLGMVQFGEGASAFDWAVRFEDEVRRRLLAGDGASLAEVDGLGPDARLSVPTPDHFLPLLYAVGASDGAHKIRFPTDGIDAASISMLSVVFG